MPVEASFGTASIGLIPTDSVMLGAYSVFDVMGFWVATRLLGRKRWVLSLPSGIEASIFARRDGTLTRLVLRKDSGIHRCIGWADSAGGRDFVMPFWREIVHSCNDHHGRDHSTLCAWCHDATNDRLTWNIDGETFAIARDDILRINASLAALQGAAPVRQDGARQG